MDHQPVKIDVAQPQSRNVAGTQADGGDEADDEPVHRVSATQVLGYRLDLLARQEVAHELRLGRAPSQDSRIDEPAWWREP